METPAMERPAPRQTHFTHLMASAPERRAEWRFSSSFVSVAAHAALIAGLFWLNVNAPTAALADEEIVTFLDVRPEPPKVEEPKPEPPKPEPARVDAPPMPKGTQALLPPEAPPAAIPAVDLSAPAVSAEDFSGVGTIGGVADGVEGAPIPEVVPEEPAGEAYEIAVLERKPVLTNMDAVAAAIERLYPKMLKEAGIGGTVTLQFVIEPDGSVDPATVKVADSPFEALSEASVAATSRFRFRPGRFQGRDVRVLIVMPISWVPPR